MARWNFVSRAILNGIAVRLWPRAGYRRGMDSAATHPPTRFWNRTVPVAVARASIGASAAIPAGIILVAPVGGERAWVAVVGWLVFLAVVAAAIALWRTPTELWRVVRRALVAFAAVFWVGAPIISILAGEAPVGGVVEILYLVAFVVAPIVAISVPLEAVVATRRRRALQKPAR